MVTESEPDETALRWQRFRELAYTRDHWAWRNGWQPGRRSYWWFVSLGAHREVGQLASRYMAALDLPCLDPPEARHLHISVQQVGFSDQVGAGEVAAILHRARRDEPRVSLDLRLGPIEPNPESVALHVSPWQQIHEHRRWLRRITGDVLGAARLPGTEDHFWPHVTVGYTNVEAPAGPIARALEACPALPEVAVTVRELDLVLLGRDDRKWTWDVIGSVPLSA